MTAGLTIAMALERDRSDGDGTHAVFDAIAGRRKRLMFSEGDHDNWPAEAIRHSVAFINEYTA